MRHRCCRLKIKILPRVVVANILYYPSGPFNVIWQFTSFDFFAKQVAQYTPEILVPWKRKKAS